MASILLSMFIFALSGAISPGPVNIIATGSGAAFGFRQTLPHITGASLAYTLIVLLAGSGLLAILKAVPGIFSLMQYLGAGFLLYMAYKLATAPAQAGAADRPARPPGLLAGMLAQGLNPKAWLVALSGCSLFVGNGPKSGAYLLAFCVISCLVCFFSVAAWAAAGGLIRKYLSDTRHQVMFNRAAGLLLAATVFNIFR
ncbi:LysE family translocator [Thalassomonas viridans]|uniref:LysE family translocator n=1 Tax=Thalassomonas viridans TaxID=137584 RepID=A0AAF0C7W4_9GAMM|nr:LysE family translocator [Thalassomonas viridans]WDE05757.1 LysE family translocator [Thalassomonas viridans]